jgi:hypothetical protein
MQWAESEFVNASWKCQVDFCPFRGPDAPLTRNQNIRRVNDLPPEKAAAPFDSRFLDLNRTLL